jgi:hypothetical protein
MAEAPIPIRRVRRDGEVDILGEWRAATKDLALDRPGFPLTPAGNHKIEGDVPWVFDEMAPDGYLAARYATDFVELALPRERRVWTARNVLDVLQRYGADLSGNLVIGEMSFHQLCRRRSFEAAAPEMSDDDLRGYYPLVVDHLLKTPLTSSVGGSRPKMVLGGTVRPVIVKFTPPFRAPFGQRWSNLLRMEALAAQTLRSAGIDAVQSQYIEQEDRGYLEIVRFDRFPGGGRVGHVTLFNLGVALYGEASNPEVVVAGLVRDGHLPPEDAERFARQHAFSKAIANTDTHVGNYGLIMDDDGNARLSPAYDVLPMAFAPKHDELPDRLVKHTGPRDAATDELVQRLIAAVEADREISAEFRESWLRVVR